MENFDPLASTTWLAQHLDDPDIRVVDIRGYVKKHDLGDGRQQAEYLAAREELDTYTQHHEQARDAGEPVPTHEEDDQEYQRLNEQLNDALAAAPWWARFVYP